MADIKISELPVATTPNSTDVYVVNQNGVTKQISSLVIGNVQTVGSIAELKTFTPVEGRYIYAAGYYADGDGGGGFFYGAINGTFVDNGGSIIVPTGGDGTTAWLRIIEGPVSVKYFGAVCDGVANDTAKVTAAAALNLPLYFPASSTLITTNTTLANPISIEGGAVIKVDNCTLTLLSSFSANAIQVFNCVNGGAVAFDQSNTLTAYPEWWGADTNNLSADCTAAIMAAYMAAPRLQLQAADYWINGGLIFDQDNKTIEGHTEIYSANNPATRIVTKSASATILQLGPTVQPPTIPDFCLEPTIKNIGLTRGVPPSIASDAIGLDIRFTQYGKVNNVFTAENMVGFRYLGNVELTTNITTGSRVQNGAGVSANDYFTGHFFSGFANIGTAGGNASLRIYSARTACSNIALNDTLYSSTGALFSGTYGWSDIWLYDCEFGGTARAVNIIGNNNTSGTIDAQNQDLIFVAPILDIFTVTGISISNLSKYGAVTFLGGYMMPYFLSAGLVSGAYILDSQGSVDMTDMQLNWIGVDCPGILIANSSKVRTRNEISECASTAVSLVTASNCYIEDKISNESTTASGPVVALNVTSVDNVIRPLASGKSAARPYGIQLIDTASTRNTLDPSGIEPTIITAKTNAVRINIPTVGNTLCNTQGYVNDNYIYGLVATGAPAPSSSLNIIAAPAPTTDYFAPAAGAYSFTAPVDGFVEITASYTTVSGSTTGVLAVNKNGAAILGPIATGAAGSVIYTEAVTAGSVTTYQTVYNTGASAPVDPIAYFAFRFFPK